MAWASCSAPCCSAADEAPANFAGEDARTERRTIKLRGTAWCLVSRCSVVSSYHAKKASRMPVGHRERHRTKNIGWLRAAVLGANDGVLSTASLVLGVTAAHGTRGSVLVAGVAGLVAGAMSMAAGEYVSVHSQADTERADLKRERAELKADDKGKHKELTAIYVGRGLEHALAKKVADQLMAHDALALMPATNSASARL